jgi:hypothetical protein
MIWFFSQTSKVDKMFSVDLPSGEGHPRWPSFVIKGVLLHINFHL